MKLAVVLVFLSSIHAFAGPAEKTKVKIDCTCNDAVGARFATALRDVVASSPRYVETPLSNEPGKDAPWHWVISIVSVDGELNNPNVSTALSIVILVGDDIFMSQFVQVCGSEKIKDCAAHTFASFDAEVVKMNAGQ
jgi:hypothetical protein